MKLVKTNVSYSIELSHKMFIALLDRDYENEEKDLPVLSTLIDAQTVVYETDYNGHYGTAIFYDVKYCDDSEQLHEDIKSLITLYLK